MGAQGTGFKFRGAKLAHSQNKARSSSTLQCAEVYTWVLSVKQKNVDSQSMQNWSQGIERWRYF